MRTEILSNTGSHKYMRLVHTFLRKLLKDVLHPDEVVNLERGRDIVQTMNQHRSKVKGSPARQL